MPIFFSYGLNIFLCKIVKLIVKMQQITMILPTILLASFVVKFVNLFEDIIIGLVFK